MITDDVESVPIETFYPSGLKQPHGLIDHILQRQDTQYPIRKALSKHYQQTNIIHRHFYEGSVTNYHEQDMPQKRSLRQIEKQQRRREKSQDKSVKIEKTIGALDIPDMNSEELISQLGNMKAITPTRLAVSLNLKVSMAKKLLEQLKEQRIVKLVSRSHNLKVYQLT